MFTKDIANINLILKISGVKKLSYVFVIVLAIISSFAAVLPAQIIGLITDITIGKKQNIPSLSILNGFFDSAFPQAVALILLLLVVTILASIFRNYFCYKTSLLSNTIILSTRRQMIDRLVDVDNKYYEDHKKGEIIFNVMNNNSSLENIFSTALFTMGSDIFGLLWIIIILLNTNATLLLILLAFFPFIYYLSLMTGKAQRELSQKRINIENDMTAFVDQTITGIDIIKSYFGKNREINTYTKFANDIFGFSKHADRKLSVYFVIETAIKTTALVCALYFCVKMIEKGQLTTGIIPMVIIYSEKLFSPVSNFTKYYQIIQRGLVSLNQISDLLRFPLSKKEFISQTALTISPNNSLSIKSLCVNRKEKNIFEDFNLNISSNGLYLIRGESGSGKSTLIKAILGFLEPLRGTIAINGVTHYSYNYLSYAGQDPFLTDATILDNTLYPYDSQSSDRDLISNAQLLIKNTRLNRIDAQKMIGEFGGKISSGEKQRICFLRALLKSTPVLLLDEITSNVDYETEMLMINMLKIEKRKRIVLLATHSMNQELLNAADMIIQL